MCVHIKLKHQLKTKLIAVSGFSWGGRLNQNSTIFVSWRVHFLRDWLEQCSQVTYESSCLVRLPDLVIFQTAPQKAHYFERKSITFFSQKWLNTTWIIKMPKMWHFWNPCEGILRLYYREFSCCFLLSFLTTMLLCKEFCDFLF